MSVSIQTFTSTQLFITFKCKHTVVSHYCNLAFLHSFRILFYSLGNKQCLSIRNGHFGVTIFTKEVRFYLTQLLFLYLNYVCNSTTSFTNVIIIVIMLTDLLTVINLNFGEKCFFGKMVIFAFRKVGNSL